MTHITDAAHLAESASSQAIFDYPVQSFINGETYASTGGTYLNIIDPGTGQVIGELADSGAGDVDAAVAAARAAFKDGRWSEVDPEERERILFRLADLVERDAEILSEIEARDTGKPLAEARLDIAEAASVLRYFAGWCTKASGTVVPAPREYFATTTREPLGVCAAITPWNYPLPILTYKVGPALAFGNTVVAKPSELASASSVLLAHLAYEAGVPAGVFNVVTGGRTAGEALSASTDVDKIAFTGSTATGKAILRAAAETLTPATVELGGKSAQVIFEDADLEAAVEGVAAGIWTNAGQICIAGSRVLVQESIKEKFLKALTERTGKLSLGHSMDPGADIGPVISEGQLKKIKSFLTEAQQAGASVSTSSTTVPDHGFFLAPTIVSGIPAGHPLASQEVFGPVLAIDTFTDEQDAVEKANSTEYGLAAGLWTKDVSRVHRITRKLEAGTVWANTYGVFHPTLPFGGMKASGFGRELGPQAVEHYTHSKTSVLHLAP
ncbi:phenylacetaldehyde dehydrogenase [Arthrobacter sp. cf158]|uniref:aldehyde dehydrogenase family protein n=1 Tax=Arthrobacter sp. cf158 TaxID=1761744 RepID=UPI0008978474|nr:aldehyde dehydrogenase family protein [Arthrobacter sp. cf158]SDW90547.1 phenylacetaldehyde dehydrogenase [Arthrobacter sp. cf158]